MEAFLRGKGDPVLALYRRFVQLVQACGPLIVAPAKTRIGFQVRMFFAAVNKLTDRQLDTHVILTRRLEHPRFHRIETLTPRCHVHYFRVHTPDELDDEVAAWLREAYEVGTQRHLSS